MSSCQNHAGCNEHRCIWVDDESAKLGVGWVWPSVGEVGSFLDLPEDHSSLETPLVMGRYSVDIEFQEEYF
jgi:hypothetical protein